ncbi:MAG: EVE domain-containing protein [Bacteroidota bacterium]|nr:EVE domain-containing protein [Bacteroidota bacterium]MDQ6903946.1 EVE domain-containing protein [Bacteroidota bacterium]
MTKYFLICASKDHVLTGVKQGIAQAGHGRKDFISKPSKGDWIVYYSSKDKFEDGKAYQKFTAIGQITDDESYQPDTRKKFKPYRRNVDYKTCNETEIRALIEDLSFIKNKKRWGFYLISGFREISKEDFEVIKHEMNRANLQ